MRNRRYFLLAAGLLLWSALAHGQLSESGPVRSLGPSLTKLIENQGQRAGSVPFGYILNQTETTGASSRNNDAVGQVFRPVNSGLLLSVTMKLLTHESNCNTFHLRVYDWLGGPADSPDGAQGDLLAEAGSSFICSGTSYPTPTEFSWGFSGVNRVALTTNHYYFLQITHDAGSVPSVDWQSSDNDSLIDGSGWIRSAGHWIPTNTDLYLVIQPDTVGETEITSPGSGVLPARSLQVTTILSQPADNAYDTLQLVVTDYYSHAVVLTSTESLTPNDTTLGRHSVVRSISIPRSGYFSAVAQTLACGSGPCAAGPASRPSWFSELSEPPQSQFLLQQMDTTGASSRNSDAVGQVFRPVNSGLLQSVTMKLFTHENYCNTFHLRIYDWLGGPAEKP